MHDPIQDPNGPDQRPPVEPAERPQPARGQDPTGFVHFLVENPASAGITREALVRAVQALVRERDYLRRQRDQQLAEHEVDTVDLREHIADLEQLLEGEYASHEEQIGELRSDVEAHRALIDRLVAERDALEVDRDRWQELASRTPRERVVRTLKGLIPSRWRAGESTDDRLATDA